MTFSKCSTFHATIQTFYHICGAFLILKMKNVFLSEKYFNWAFFLRISIIKKKKKNKTQAHTSQ